MSTIGILCDILIDRLHTNLDTSASIRQHLVQMRLQTIVWSGLDRDTNTFGSKVEWNVLALYIYGQPNKNLLALFGVGDSFKDRRTVMSR
jgi:hypothetical protein